MLKWLQDAAIHLWIFDFFAWCTFCWFAFKDKRSSSSLITLTVVLVLDSTMFQFATLVKSFSSAEYTTVVRAAYYGGFAVFNVLAIFMIYQTHKVLGQDYKFLARTYLLAYFILAWCQILRFAERLYFDSNTFKLTYNLAISAINIGTALCGGLIALMTIYMHLSNSLIGGKIWKI